LIIRNQRDKNALVKKLIGEDEIAIPAKHDTEIDEED
jgi:hypothetical protein